jgi:hypothetical protein
VDIYRKCGVAEIGGRGSKDILVSVSVLDCVRDLLDITKSEVGKLLLLEG